MKEGFVDAILEAYLRDFEYPDGFTSIVQQAKPVRLTVERTPILPKHKPPVEPRVRPIVALLRAERRVVDTRRDDCVHLVRAGLKPGDQERRFWADLCGWRNQLRYHQLYGIKGIEGRVDIRRKAMHRSRDMNAARTAS